MVKNRFEDPNVENINVNKWENIENWIKSGQLGRGAGEVSVPQIMLVEFFEYNIGW